MSTATASELVGDTGVRAAPERPSGEADRVTLLMVTLTCAVTAVSFIGAVTPVGVGAFVLPGVVIGAVAALVGRGAGPWWRGAVVGSVVALVWAQLINLVGGDLNGPIARSTFTAGVASAFAISLVRSAGPALFLVPVAAIVLGAEVLGAAGEVGPVAAAAAVMCALTLGMAEHRRRRWLARSRRLWATLAMITLIAGTALAVGILMPVLRGPESALSSGTDVNPSIAPPWQPTTTPTPSPSPPPPADQQVTADQDLTQTIVLWLLVLLLVIGLTVLALLIWRRWRLAVTRARLRSGSPRDQVAGAWVWARLRLGRRGMDIEPSLSPDLIPHADLPATLHPEAADRLASLAATTTAGAFAAAEPDDAMVARAWEDSDWLVANVRRSRGAIRHRHR